MRQRTLHRLAASLRQVAFPVVVFLVFLQVLEIALMPVIH